MSHAEYTLRFSEEEIGRLRRQAGRFAGATERVFHAARIGPGMRVLDIGCGAGDVAILVGNLVGPQGSVVAVDSDPRMVAIARQRSAESPAPLEILEADILSIPRGREFDAVVGRFVMMYQRDTTAAVARLARHLEAGGRFAFVEPDYSVPPMSVPSLPVWDRVSQLIAAAFTRTGTPANLAFDLHRALALAGCVRPAAAVVDAFIHFAGSPYSATHVAVLRSLLPEIERLGLATGAELDLDTIAERLDAEATAIRGLGRGSLVFGVWGSLPA